MSNPFNPSFGKRPTHYYGREDITRSIISAVDDENSPWRTTLITGVRGSGKTALLSDIKINLNSSDVISLYIVPNEALLDSILSQLYRQLPKSITDSIPELNNISVKLGINVDFKKDHKKPNFTESFSYQIMELVDIFMKNDKHIVFLVDEAQKHTEDMRVFIGTYQDLIMRNYSVSMVMAGLPSVISDILNDDVLTFLRRAKQIELENVEIMIIEYEFNKVFLNVSTNITKEIVTKAAAGTYGYPYLIQLVGYYLWDDLHNNKNEIELEGIFIKSKSELFKNVHKLVYAKLSNKDRKFIHAMSEDEGPSYVSVIGERMEKKKNYVSLYRERLISAGVIKSCGHGLLAFNYPYMREYLNKIPGGLI